MAKKRTNGPKAKPHKEKAVSRRDFFKRSVAAGIGAGALPASGQALAQDMAWSYEADVLVCGAGCTGLHAAIRARDLGASVLVVDANFDVGGKMLHSGGFVSLGGGDG